MNQNGLNKFYWGFVFILLSFRIQGFDILPDVIGYLFFASGFAQLASGSGHFGIAARYNIPMILLSILTIYQPPAQSGGGGGVNFGPLGILGIPIGIASWVLSLLVVYHLFTGVGEMAEMQGRADLAAESDARWNEFKILQIAVLLSFIFIFIPQIALFYFIALFIASILVAVSILSFIKRCGENLT